MQPVYLQVTVGANGYRYSNGGHNEPLSSGQLVLYFETGAHLHFARVRRVRGENVELRE